MAEEETTTQKGEKIMDRVFNNRIPSRCDFCGSHFLDWEEGNDTYYACVNHLKYQPCATKYYKETKVSWMVDYKGLKPKGGK